NPLPERQGNELWAIVRPDVGRDAPLDEEIALRLDDLGGLQFPGHTDGNRFACLPVRLNELGNGDKDRIAHPSCVVPQAGTRAAQSASALIAEGLPIPS